MREKGEVEGGEGKGRACTQKQKQKSAPMDDDERCQPTLAGWPNHENVVGPTLD